MVRKSDKLDAFAVAERLRIRAIKRAVYKKRGPVRRAGTSSEGALCWRCSPPLYPREYVIEVNSDHKEPLNLFLAVVLDPGKPHERCLYFAITDSENTVSHHAGSCAHLTLGVQG